MIIMTYSPVDVGERVTTQLIVDASVVAVDHPFLVLREATFEEYRDDHADEVPQGVRMSWHHRPGAYYYEVSTD